MATPSVYYEIEGKYKDTGEKKAKAGIESLAKSVKAISFVAVGKAVATAVKGITTVVKNGQAGFVEQQKAITKLNEALKNNSNLTQQGAKKVKEFADQMPRLWDDDTINNAAAFASNMKLSETQIIETLSAAQDLAASGIMPLDQAVKVLSQSYSGNINQLKKINPELATMTKEELAQGKAVEAIKNQYKGLADVMSDTFDGRNKTFENVKSNLSAAFGGIGETLKYIAEGKLIEPLKKVTQWVEDNQANIVGGILAIPKILSSVFNLVKGVINKFGETNFIIKLLKDSWKACLNFVKNVGVLFGNLIGLITGMTIEFIKTLDTGNLGTLILNALKKIINNFLNMLVLPYDILLALFKGDWGKAGRLLVGAEDTQLVATAGFKYGNADQNQAINAASNYWDNNVNTLTTGVNNLTTGIVEGAKLITSNFEDVNEEFIANVKDAVKEGVLTAEKAMAKGKGSNSSLPGVVTEDTGAVASEAAEIVASSGISSMLGELTAPLMAMAEGMQSVKLIQELMNPIAIMAQSFIDTIDPMLEAVLLPLKDVFVRFGQILAGVLVPLIEAISIVVNVILEVIIWLYNNIFIYVFDIIAGIAAMIANTVVALINIVKSIYNLFAWNKVAYTNMIEMKYAGKINADEITAMSSQSSSSSSGSASYTAARDIYVTINYNNSYVNGDARAIAINLRDEIRSAEKLGY